MTASPTLIEAPPVTAGAAEHPTVWGLDARDMHEAFWRSRGVQPIERGSSVPLQRGAELYLLTEPGQLVLFDLGGVTDRMTWNGGRILRLRVVDQADDRYSERVILDERGLVARIERSYRPRTRTAYRVILTRSERVARVWQRRGSRRDAWREARRLVPYYQIDHWRAEGAFFAAGDPEAERRFLDRLVGAFEDPSRSIEGVVAVDENVWGRDGTTVDPDHTLVGPAWLGDGERPAGFCLIGPAWCPDEGDPDAPEAEPRAFVRLREIEEIEPPRASEGETSDRDLLGFYPITKRAFDLTASVLVLTLASPVILAIAVAILFDDGRPFFYGHRRQTRGGRAFRCWKFRTMKNDADRLVQELAAMNQCDGPQFYIADDPRVTRVGRFLRRTHLDELPQFWNVLLGQMSVVGPRPSPDDENQYCPAWREIRLSVRPGITGLWQVQRTREPGKDFQEWIRYDIEYVRRANFWFDVTICFKTIQRILFGRASGATDQTR